jgi:molybdopterin-guanine dinucleotide biosynthesis protein A
MKKISKMPAILFAGGKSSRMGQDKALLPYGGFDSLAEFGYRNLCNIFEDVYISAKNDKFDFCPPLVFDKFEESSPLVGIISIFDELKCNEFFILSVDMPCVEKKDILKLLDFADHHKDCDAIIACSPNGIEPLFGIYRNSIYDTANSFLKENNHKLTALIKQSKNKLFEFENEDIFLNLNYPSDYEQAIKLFHTKRSI